MKVNFFIKNERKKNKERKYECKRVYENITKVIKINKIPNYVGWVNKRAKRKEITNKQTDNKKKERRNL